MQLPHVPHLISISYQHQNVKSAWSLANRIEVFLSISFISFVYAIYLRFLSSFLFLSPLFSSTHDHNLPTQVLKESARAQLGCNFLHFLLRPSPCAPTSVSFLPSSVCLHLSPSPPVSPLDYASCNHGGGTSGGGEGGGEGIGGLIGLR